MTKKRTPIQYQIVDDYDEVFDEKGNTFLSMRKLCWGENPDTDKAKFDMRKWYVNADGEESPHKGFSFLTEDGPDNLAKVLINNGFGHTKEILNGIKDRDDFQIELNNVMGPDSDHFDKDVKDDLYEAEDNLCDYEE